MIKTLHNVLKRDRERFTIPKTVQDSIPVKTIWSDGIFRVGNLFSKTFQFSDINCRPFRLRRQSPSPSRGRNGKAFYSP